jgi:hypothetical protein
MLTRPVFEDLKESLGLKQKAATNGAQNLPESASTLPDSVEDTIQSHIRGLHRGNCEKVETKLSAEAAKRLNIARPIHEDALVRELRDMQSRATGQLQELEARKRNGLKELLKAELRMQRQYNAFRVMNHLQHREAHYPTSQWLHWAFLACFVLLESIFNSYFFKEATDAGFLGGIFVAAMISFVNVIFAYLLGSFVIPQFHHVNKGVRTLLASSGLLVCLTAIVLINLAAAHTRAIIATNQASQVTSTEAFRQAIYQLKDRPLGIDHLEAWILLALGLVIAALAVWKGYRSDDPYPGYGELDRHLKEAKEAYRAERDTYTQAVITSITQVRYELETNLKKTQSQVNEYHSSMKESYDVAHEYEQSWMEENRVLTSLVRYYREVNKSVRTNPCPAYFDREPELIIRANLVPVTSAEEQEAGRLKQIIVNLQDVAEMSKKSLGTIQEEYLSRLEELHKKCRIEGEEELRREAVV